MELLVTVTEQAPVTRHLAMFVFRREKARERVAVLRLRPWSASSEVSWDPVHGLAEVTTESRPVDQLVRDVEDGQALVRPVRARLKDFQLRGIDVQFARCAVHDHEGGRQGGRTYTLPAVGAVGR